MSSRSFWYSLTLFAAVLAGLQVYGGAYSAEFDGHADEAAHFVSSLLVHDYLAQWPWQAPLPWAMDYYVHYPKVAIGHWPPGYYAIQALWWLVLPPGRMSAMLLNIAMGLASMGLFLCVAKRIVNTWKAAAAGTALLFLPVMQQAHAQAMAETPSVLFAMLLLWTMVRLLEAPRAIYLGWTQVALAGALAVKSVSVALVAGPALALAFGKEGWRRLPLPHLIGLPLLAGIAVAGMTWLQFQGSIGRVARLGGFAKELPWGITMLPDITGTGVLALAAAGAAVAAWQRQPAAVAALSIAVSMLAASYFVRAMREPRHWIAIVPILALLCLAAYGWLERRTRWAPLAVVLAMATYPYEIYRQQPAGFAALAAQVHLPARMLISSPHSWEEGPWIAAVCLRESRPSSTVIRASKLLAHSNWNSTNYRSLVETPEDVERKVDESAIDLVVVRDAPESNERVPHHRALVVMLRENVAWKRCGAAGSLTSFCRVQPPKFPRKPLEFDFQERLGRNIAESVP